VSVSYGRGGRGRGRVKVGKSKTEELFEPLGLALVIALHWLIEHDHDSSRQLLG